MVSDGGADSYLDFRLLLHALHLRVLGVGGDGPAPDFDPDEHVAQRDEYERQHVAAQQVGHQEVHLPAHAVRPHLRHTTSRDVVELQRSDSTYQTAT